MANKVIFHCGSSKNGSTALQSFLLKNFSQLVSLGIFPLTSYYFGTVDVSNRNSVYDVNCIFFHADLSLSLTEISNATASFGIPYEAYKQFIFERDTASLKSLLKKIKSAIECVFSYKNIHTLIISAEAFETSLCLKDPIFKKILKVLSRQFDIEVVYYVPKPVRHAIASWLEWGWIEHYQYPEWVAAYSVMTDRSAFYGRRATGVGYFSNLLNTFSWISYWRAEGNINYSFIEDQKDIIDHFFKVILNIDYATSDFDCSLSQKERNVGWPKSLITSFPLFFEFLSQDYVKFEVIRQLLRDKDSFFVEDLSNYNDMLKLTSVIFDEISNLDTDSSFESNERINSSLVALRALFNNNDKNVFRRVITYLCETFYYYHEKQLQRIPSNNETYT